MANERLSALIPSADLPSSQFRNAFLRILTKSTLLDSAVETEEDHVIALNELRPVIADDLALAVSTITEEFNRAARAGVHQQNRLQAKLRQWQDNLRNSGEFLGFAALHEILSVGEAFSVRGSHRLLQDSPLTQRKNLIHSWRAWTLRIGGHAKFSPSNRDIQARRHRELERILGANSGQYVVPGNLAKNTPDKSLLASQYSLRDKETKALGIREITYYCPCRGCLIEFLAIHLTTVDGATLVCRYFPNTGELYGDHGLISLRVLYEKVDKLDLYNLLREYVLCHLAQLCLDGTYDHFSRSPTYLKKPLDAQQEEVDDPDSEDTDQGVVVQNVVEDIDRVPPSTDASDDDPYLRDVGFLEGVAAFERLGLIISYRHHTMVTRNGTTVEFASRHQRDRHVLRKKARRVCKVLGIPWADFVNALR